MVNKVYCFILSLLLSGFATALQGQNVIGSFGNASSNSMGGISASYEDIRGLPLNPSSIGGIKQVQGYLFADQRFGLKELTSYSLGFAIPTSSGAFGLSLGRYGFGLYNENLLSLGYSRKLLNNLTIGGAVDYRSIFIQDYGNKGAVGFQLGITTQVTSTTTLFFSVANPNRPKINESDRLPGIFTIGGSYAPGKNVIIRAELNKTLENKEDFKVGFEYFPSKNLILRIGGHTFPAQYTFGFGLLVLDSLTLEASSKYDPRLGLIPGFGVSYGIKNSK